jgi:hypothetical protein
MLVFVMLRLRGAPEPSRTSDHAALPLWTWFVENPRSRSRSFTF